MKSFRLPPPNENVGSYFINLDNVTTFYRIGNSITFNMGEEYTKTAEYENEKDAIEAIKDIHKACSVWLLT